MSSIKPLLITGFLTPVLFFSIVLFGIIVIGIEGSTSSLVSK